MTACAELDSYKEVAEGFYAPTWIQITTFSQDEAREPLTITLTLRSIKARETRWPDIIFDRKHPGPGSFKNMGVVINGRWIEQPQ